MVMIIKGGLKMINFINKPSSITVNDLKKRDYSFCPSDYRNFKYKYEGSQLKDLVTSNKVGKEIGSALYIKNTRYKFLKTRNIRSNFLLDKEFSETCGKVDSIKPYYDSFFIAKDGGGEGLGDISYYDRDQFDENDYISSGILNIVPVEKYKYYLLAVLKYKHFKSFIDLYTKKGSTIRHSKKLALDYLVPLSESNRENISQISILMKSICDNEVEIRKSFKAVDDLINNELLTSRSAEEHTQTFIDSLKANNFRMDSGMYTDSFLRLDSCLKHYSNGTFSIPLNEIKSGSTPDVRLFSDTSKFMWVTPTDIQTNGLFSPSTRISMHSANNINKDCLLIINRGDKYDVGISMFYDYSVLGVGHHNQGIYRIESYDKKTLICMSAYLNSSFCRNYCKCISYGTKMREMKSIDFCKLLFPKFSNDVADKISNFYLDSQKGILILGQRNIELREEMNKKLDELYSLILN